MVWFWIILAVILILLGLFIFSQGGQSLGPAVMTVGVVILLILLVSPARAGEIDDEALLNVQTGESTPWPPQLLKLAVKLTSEMAGRGAI